MCNNLNDFYINIAQEIGINNQSTDSPVTHPSIHAIKEISPKEGYDNFDFEHVSGSQNNCMGGSGSATIK